MVNKVNNCPSFGSTRIPYNNVPVHKYLEPLNKYFEVKEFNLMKPQEAADKLDFGKAAAMFDKDGMIIVGKDGGPGGADTFIGRLLKKVSPDVEYIDDVKPVEIDGPVIDLNI